MNLRIFSMMTPEELPPDLKNTIIRHINLFKFIGMDILLFDDSDRGVLKKHGKFILFTIAVAIMMVCEIIYVVTSVKNGATFVDLADAVPPVMLLVQDLTLLVVITYRRNEIRELIFDIAEVWPDENNMAPEQTVLLKTWLKRLKLFENFFLPYAFLGTLCFLAVPLFLTLYQLFNYQQEVYLFPVNIYAPFKVDSMTRYLAKYAFESIFSFCLHVCTHVSTILLLAALTVDISALMRLLQYDLENIVQERSLMQRGYGDTSEHHRKIKCVVKTHQKLLRFTVKLNKIFGIIVLVPALLTSIILCFFGFLSITANRVQMMRNSLAVFGVLFEIFNLSWPGQLLADTSSGIATAAYRSRWYDSDVKFRKIILTIIARSRKPCYISAMGYTNMTLHSFAKILSSSWSYLSLLRQTYQKNSDD